MVTHWRWLTALALAALLALTAVMVPRGADAQDVSVTPASGTPGTRFTFEAAGFQAGERVSYWANSPDGSVVGDSDFYVFADDTGHARWSWTAPTSAVGGFWSVVALGMETGQQRTTSFQITGPTEQAQAQAAALPTSGVPGTTFAFYALGFDEKERISYWANSPSGVVFGSESYRLNASPEGRADWRWTAPADAQSGTWTMVARGHWTDVTRVILITIGTPPQPTALPQAQAPAQAVEPLDGGAGTRFAFSASGFQPGERVSYWANSPDGAIVGDPAAALYADSAGRAAGSWQAPLGALPGGWQIVVFGNQSNQTRLIPFSIR